MKNITLAIEAAPAAIPVNPNMDAMIAITKKISVHFNIVVSFGDVVELKILCYTLVIYPIFITYFF